MSDEKRAFSRVPVRLKGYARAMMSPDSEPKFVGDVVSEKGSADDPFRNSKLPDEVTSFLSEMDRKIDRVLGLLSQDHLRSDFPIEIEILELSAAGVKFRCQEVIPADAYLEIVILLSYVPLRMAGSKGRILGTEDGSKDLYRVEFVDTRGSDMEAIVQFVFRHQREQIRNSRM